MPPTTSTATKSTTKAKRSQDDAQISSTHDGHKKAREGVMHDALLGSDAGPTIANSPGPNEGLAEDPESDETLNLEEDTAVVFTEYKDWYGQALTRQLVWVKSGREHFLAKGPTDGPVTIFMPGSIARLWLFDIQGKPVKNPAVIVNPMDSRDLAAMKVLMRRFSRCDRPLAVPTDFRASRLQYAPRTRGVATSEVSPFDQIYDARKVFQGKDKMKHMGTEDLMEGDVVLLECKINQFSPRRETFSDSSSEWRVSFKLEGVHVLAQPPSDDVIPVPESPFNFKI